MIRILRVLPLAALCAAPAMAQTLQPGIWEHTNTMTSAEIPGAPPEMMAALLGQTTTTSSCITQEQLDQGAQALFDQSNGQCDFSEFSMEGGRLHMVGSCAGPQGSANITANGTYTATTYESESMVTAATPGGEMRIEATASGRRTGDC